MDLCGSCREKFSGIAAFDAHIYWTDKKRGFMGCKPPAEVGLKNDGKVWYDPEARANLVASVQGSEKPEPVVRGLNSEGRLTVDKQGNKRHCRKCNKELSKKPGRGRWPTVCQSCKGE